MKVNRLDVKKGLDRLVRVYCWPNDPQITDKDKVLFDALCEFVLFKEFVLNPFFNSLLRFLFEHIGDLYKHLYTVQMNKIRMLSYRESFLFMRELGVDRVRLILEQSPCCPSNVYNGILKSLEEENYDRFYSSLDNSDYTKMMQVLWLMRYILYGENRDMTDLNPSISRDELRRCFPGWLSKEDYFTSFFKKYEEDQDAVLKKLVLKIAHVDLKERRVLRRNKRNIIEENHDEENRIELERVFGESLFKTYWRDLFTEYSNTASLLSNNAVKDIEGLGLYMLIHNVIINQDVIKDNYGVTPHDNLYNEYEWCVQDYYEDDTKDFGMYILYYTREMYNVYNTVEAVLPDVKKEELNNLLNYLSYLDFLKSMLPFNIEAVDASDGNVSKSKELLEKWKENIDPHKKIKTFYPIRPLKYSEIEKLTQGLSETKGTKGAFIEKDTKPERLVHILSGAPFDGKTPIIWIKKLKKNKQPNKKSVLNFLRLLGVDWEDIKPERLNACFICSNADYKKYDNNNIDKRSEWAQSECHEELKTIIRAALGKDHKICKRWSDNPPK